MISIESVILSSLETRVSTFYTSNKIHHYSLYYGTSFLFRIPSPIMDDSIPCHQTLKSIPLVPFKMTLRLKRSFCTFFTLSTVTCVDTILVRSVSLFRSDSRTLPSYGRQSFVSVVTLNWHRPTSFLSILISSVSHPCTGLPLPKIPVVSWLKTRHSLSLVSVKTRLTTLDAIQIVVVRSTTQFLQHFLLYGQSSMYF